MMRVLSDAVRPSTPLTDTEASAIVACHGRPKPPWVRVTRSC